MANFLASVGRARPSRNVLDVIQGGISLDQNQRRNQMTAADLAMSAEQLAQLKRQGEYQEQLRKEGETPIAIETLASGFEGGDQGPMFKMVYDMADKAGYIDKSTGGMGTIKKGQMPEIGQMMAEPGFMSKLSRTRIDYWRTQHGQIKAALAEKPTDQKLLQAFQQANTGLNQALGQDKALMDAEKQRLVAEKQAETERHNTAMENKSAITEDKLGLYRSKKEIDKEFKEPGSTAAERHSEKLRAETPDLIIDAQADPMKVYKQGYRMNDDGTLFVDRVEKTAVELRPFDKVMGKRGGPAQLRAAGDQLDNAEELMVLLQDPEVAADLKKSVGDSTLWDRARGTISNRIDAYMTKAGIAEDSKTASALRRMQMMASGVRKEYLGSAVTATELKTITGWLLDPGDSYDAMMNKAKLISGESKQEFKRFLDFYRHEADIGYLYEEYGVDRFKKSAQDMSDDELLQSLGIKGK